MCVSCTVVVLTCFVICGCVYVGFCNMWCVCVCVGFVMCGCFDNMCTCIYCVFLLFRLCIFILICYWCKDYCTQWKLNLVNNNNNNNTCRHRSVEQMADKCRPVRRKSELPNSNTRPSHTNKKLQEVYFEATKHWWAVQKMRKRTGDNPAYYCGVWATSIYRVCKNTWWISKSYSPETGRSSWIYCRQKSIL